MKDAHPRTDLRFVSWTDPRTGLETSRTYEKLKEAELWPPVPVPTLPPGSVTYIETGYARETRIMRK